MLHSDATFFGSIQHESPAKSGEANDLEWRVGKIRQLHSRILEYFQ